MLPRPDHVMKRRLGEMKWCDDCLLDRDLDPAGAGGGLRLDPRLVAPQEDEEPPSAPACSTAIRMSFSINLSRTISLESAWEALTTVSTSNCPTGVPIVAAVELVACNNQLWTTIGPWQTLSG